MSLSKVLDEKIIDNIGVDWLEFVEIQLSEMDYFKLKIECWESPNHDFEIVAGIPQYRGVRLFRNNKIKTGEFKAVVYFKGSLLTKDEETIKEIIE